MNRPDDVPPPLDAVLDMDHITLTCDDVPALRAQLRALRGRLDARVAACELIRKSVVATYKGRPCNVDGSIVVEAWDRLQLGQ